MVTRRTRLQFHCSFETSISPDSIIRIQNHLVFRVSHPVNLFQAFPINLSTCYIPSNIFSRICCMLHLDAHFGKFNLVISIYKFNQTRDMDIGSKILNSHDLILLSWGFSLEYFMSRQKKWWHHQTCRSCPALIPKQLIAYKYLEKR